jgi:gamma-glutamylcyclotransferase (GGCT)/AIG2-like uncharacterized protein YtfP
MTKPIYYAAYGMNTDPGAMALRTGIPTPIGLCLIRDHAFRFAVHADVYPKPGVTTYGVLWELTDEQLTCLDRREGYPTYYDRKIVEVESDGQIYQAWMYFMTPGFIETPPQSSYYQMLTSGYTHFGVPMSQIENALLSSQKALKYAFGRPTRWFDSYEQLVKLSAGKKRLARIRMEAASQHITAEQLCADYVEYGAIKVPQHFQVRNSEYLEI